MEQSVCCYVPRGARPVGLLPVLHKSKCGRKGNVAAAAGDLKSDGLADLGEWPWHVSDSYFCTCLERLFLSGGNLYYVTSFFFFGLMPARHLS